jgi:hypothetical protein
VFFQAVVSLVFAATLLFPNFSAKWGLIDDHDIIGHIGNHNALKFQEIPEILFTKTEVGFPGKMARYRPAYYFVRLIEAAIWGKNPFFWYSFRILLFGISIFIAWRLLQRSFGVVMGGLSCLVLLSHGFWSDIWSRLGPNEAYCVIGVALYCFGFLNLWENKVSDKTNLSWISLTFGAILAMGSKENFLLLLPTTAVLLYRVWRQHRLNIFSLFLNLFIFTFGTFVIIAVVLGLNNLGTDIYSNPVSPMSRYQVLKSGLFSSTQWKILLPLWISLVAFGVSRVINNRLYQSNQMVTEVLEEAKRLIVIELLLVVLWYSQYVFYNGAWPLGIRYDFPGVLARDLMYIFLLYSPVRVLQRNNSYFRLRSVSHLLHVLLLGILILAFTQFGFNELKSINYESRINSKRTQKFTESFLRISEEVRGNPATPIIFEIHSVWDYEPILSLQRFLFASGIKNPLFLNIHGLSEKTVNPGVETVLERRLHNISENGTAYKNDDLTLNSQVPFYPIRMIQQEANCFVISFSGDSNVPCKDLGRIWPWAQSIPGKSGNSHHN